MTISRLAASIAALTLATACSQTDNESASGETDAAQTDPADPMQSALSAGPADVTDAATVLDADGNVLREGTNGWTCIAETPGYPQRIPQLAFGGI